MKQLLGSMKPENFQRISTIRAGEHENAQPSIASISLGFDLDESWKPSLLVFHLFSQRFHLSTDSRPRIGTDRRANFALLL
jgi:hypothetical protein